VATGTVPQRPALVLSAAVPIKAESDNKARQGTKSKRTADQRANRKARKAERMAKKRAERRAAAEQSNAEHNPKRARIRSDLDVKSTQADDDSSSESRAPDPPRPARRGSDKASRSSRERSTRSRIAIGVLLAVGLMLGFWLLFKLPAG